MTTSVSKTGARREKRAPVWKIVSLALLGVVTASAEDAYERFDILSASSPSSSRDTEWKPGDGITLEVSGLEWVGPDRLALTTRKGDVWFVDHALSAETPEDVVFKKFASGLHEPLGILKDGDSFLVVQRSEMTRLRDIDGDDLADEYLREASGWNVSGNYHGYAYGPKRDGEGNLWVTTNLDMGNLAANDAAWRGWGSIIRPDGTLRPMAAGMRSPSGMGANLAGDMFFTDQQGTWIPATPIHHLREGAFYGNPEGIASQDLPESPVKLSREMPNGEPYPKAVGMLKELVPAAVWLPYNKMGRSATDIAVVDAGGDFGPFDGHFLVGEFTNSAVNRIYLEKVGGEYQGACFPFLSGFPAAVVRLEFAPDGSLFVGMTNRGWSSLGNRSYGLQRVRKMADIPFCISELRAKSDGFEMAFSEAVDPKTAGDVASYAGISFTYTISSKYGSDEIHKNELEIESAEVSADGLSVHLKIANLRPIYVHEIHAEGVRSAKGAPLGYGAVGYYTLNQIPE